MCMRESTEPRLVWRGQKNRKTQSAGHSYRVFLSNPPVQFAVHLFPFYTLRPMGLCNASTRARFSRNVPPRCTGTKKGGIENGGLQSLYLSHRRATCFGCRVLLGGAGLLTFLTLFGLNLLKV